MSALLLVDDDPAHRLFAARALQRAFSDTLVIEAANLHAAESAIREAQILLAVIDLKLDHESGLDALRALRNTHRGDTVPAIIVSTSDLPAQIEECYREGANCYVVKGSNPAGYAANLVSAIRFFLRDRDPLLPL